LESGEIPRNTRIFGYNNQGKLMAFMYPSYTPRLDLQKILADRYYGDGSDPPGPGGTPINVGDVSVEIDNAALAAALQGVN
jgi:hypothetical protein